MRLETPKDRQTFNHEMTSRLQERQAERREARRQAEIKAFEDEQNRIDLIFSSINAKGVSASVNLIKDPIPVEVQPAKVQQKTDTGSFVVGLWTGIIIMLAVAIVCSLVI